MMGKGRSEKEGQFVHTDILLYLTTIWLEIHVANAMFPIITA